MIMKIVSTYSVKIHKTHGAFRDTTEKYRQAVDFFIVVAINEWEKIAPIKSPQIRQREIELLTHRTEKNQTIAYNFDEKFPKFPSYLRRAAISEAIGKVSSYKSNFETWTKKPRGREPGLPKAGKIYPAMYRDNCFIRIGTYTAQLKVWIRNTWDWIEIELKKTDVKYILRNCQNRRECVPTLQKRGKNWFLDFAFEKKIKIEAKTINQQIAIGVDLGINNACACSAMLSDGTVIGRKIFSLPIEKDCLNHKLNKIKKAQQLGAKKMPRLWASAKGVNEAIARKTARFIADFAKVYNADVIVFEHLNLKGKKKGNKKQKLHHWKAQAVQKIVTDKAHLNRMIIRRVCAWKTSALAFDGSGKVERDENNYSLCTFKNGKHYHCDLSASYNIVARYFVREIIKSLPAKARLGIEAKVPQCTKRITCTLSTLLNLNAELSEYYRKVI